MFRSASARQSDLAAHRLDAQMNYWTRTASTWFDGTPACVDERIAQLDNITRHARDTVARIGSTPAGFRCGAILPDLEETRRELTAARDSLLNGFADRQGDSVLAGRRTASRPLPPESFRPDVQRAIVLGSRDFVADANTDDRDELLLRARRYAAEETSTLPAPIAHRVAAAFVGQVEELIARRPRKRQAAAPVTHYEDFDDHLMY
jgi:hypothetical protein